MKIVRIIARLNVGGPARHVVWLTSRLQNEQFQSFLLAGTVPPGEEDMSYFAERHGVQPVYISELSRELSLKDVVSLFKIWKEMRRIRPEIVHTHTAKAGTVGRVAALLYRWGTWRTLFGKPNAVRVLHTFHGHVFHGYYGKAKTRFFLMIERALARWATDRIVVISPQQFDEINGKYRVGSKDKFRVIPLGIDLTKFDDISDGRNEMRSSGDFIVGFVGRLTEIKNVPLLLRAVACYRKEPDVPNLRLVIVGDGNLREELETLAQDLGVNDAVDFLGNVEDVNDTLQTFDIVALTSNNEGTPLSLIEAMAARRPIISTAVGGVTDLLGETEEDLHDFRVCERGIAIEPGDPDKFCKGLIYLAKNEKLRSRLSDAGRSFVERQYSLDRLEKDIVELYRHLSKS